ncbi:Ankyrin repeat protein nuc-2 [Cytospora mali]|uniref:Ankyrin repeat protein nuc-2 n=1 Tax=Cytospora mali TaxID=578113 RepID=A0A194V4C6_CYTMA|nr:Ankyrin repeat protein nuc-2 [Valsa mali var. pyri (nom. inval.)]
MSDKAPESPTTVKPLDIDDDDDIQESGITMDDGTSKPTTTTGAPPAASPTGTPAPTNPSTTASSGETPPPKPPRPATEQQKNEAILKEAFPDIEASVIKAVLIASRGQIDPAFNALLGMSDPDAIQNDADEQPPPQPPRPQHGQSQLDADEAYARQLAQHYENQSAAYEARTSNRGPPRQRQQTGLKPNELHDDREYSFLDDDLPVIQEQLKKGFQETQTKVNSWFKDLKKKFDEQFDEGEQSTQPQGGRGHYARGSGQSSTRSRDYERYDADPELLSDDFAGMKFHSDGTPAHPQAQNPNLFKPPPPSASPKPGDGRKVAFKDGAEDIDIYSASPKNAPKDSSSAGTPSGKSSKWQPLSSVEPDPIAENDPFSLGDSDDDKDAKEKPDKGGIKMDDSEERLRKAAAEAMADSLVEDKAKKDEAKPKFGKQIQKRQLEVPEYAASFVNYKALKKLIKKLSATPILQAQSDPLHPAVPIDSQAALQANKATFFFQLLKIRLKTLLDKKKVLQSRNGISRRTAKFTTLQEGFQQFANDLNKLQQFVDINGTAFSKILKKWDKTSKSKTKELYLSRAVEVQPFFNPTVISELSDQVTTSLQELGALADGDHVSFEEQGRPDHIVSIHHLLGTEEGDADTLLLETVLSGNLDSLRDLLGRMQATVDPNSTMNISLMERVTRTFLASISEAPQEALQVLLNTGLVDIQSEDDINERNCLHQATIYGNTFVLNLGLEKGVAVNRTDVYGRVPLHYASMHGRLDMIDSLLAVDSNTINLIDHDNFRPLVHAIIHNHLDCVKRIIEKGAQLNPLSETDHAPLNLACKHGSHAIVELLLINGAQILPDAEGLYPQHHVARSAKHPDLLGLLKQFGADLDQIDKMYGWTPLVHAASEGNVPCLRALLNEGADPNILDEKDLPALYYAAWEGHLECMNLLIPLQGVGGQEPSPKSTQVLPPTLGPMDGNSAPEPMALDPDAIPDLELPPPIIPLRRYGHNFLDTKTVVQISFGTDGEQPLAFFHDGKYPAARLTISSKASDFIPKNIILPFTEDTRLISFQVDNLDSFILDFDVFPTYGAKIIGKTVALPNTFRASLSSSGSCCLPLFDPRLRAIGQISFNTQVIKPFQGKPLEITDFETYWKATRQFDRHISSFVTGSSLVGDFVRLYVQQTKDGVAVLWPTRTIDLGGEGMTVPISWVTHGQFEQIVKNSPARKILATGQLDPQTELHEVHRLLATAGITLTTALDVLPPSVNVNLHFIYQRAQSRQSGGSTAVRSVAFSSYSPSVCTALNWKQPNFPVFLCNDLGREEVSMAPPQMIAAAMNHGRRSSSIKEVVRRAQSNNFMGLVVASRLLKMVPALVDAIKSQGLALVVDKSAEAGPRNDASPERPPTGVDGMLKYNGVLRFHDSIDM